MQNSQTLKKRKLNKKINQVNWKLNLKSINQSKQASQTNTKQKLNKCFQQSDMQMNQIPRVDLYECSLGVLFIENDLYDPTGVLDWGFLR